MLVLILFRRNFALGFKGKFGIPLIIAVDKFFFFPMLLKRDCVFYEFGLRLFLPIDELGLSRKSYNV